MSRPIAHSRKDQPNRPASSARLVVACMALFCIVVTIVAQQPAETDAAKKQPVPDPGGSKLETLAVAQGKVADKYARLEQLLIRMAELESTSNPQRSALLKRAAQQSADRLTRQQLDTLIRLLTPPSQLKRAIDEQQQVVTDLRALLELLQSENRSDRLKSEQARVREYIKDVERLIRLQKGVQGRTEGGDDSEKLAGDQTQIAERTGELANRIRENEEGKRSDGSSKDGSAKDNSVKDEKDASDKSRAENERKDGPDGKAKSDESGTKSKSQAGSKNSSAKNGDAGKSGDKSGKESDQQDQKNGTNSKKSSTDKGKESDDSKSPDSQKTEKDGTGDKSDGKDKSNKDASGKKSGGKDGGKKGKKSAGQKGKGSESPGGKDSESSDDSPPMEDDSQENPARKRLEAAQERMREAQRKLAEANRKDASQEQQQAREELERAKAELEQILRQLREEEVERTLALLEGRFRKMLDTQLRIYESTKRLDKIPAEQRTRELDIQASKLSFDESKLAVDADKALLLLREEGSSVAFPETVELVRDDMQSVAERLSSAKVDKVTQGLEEEIVQSLEELIAALQKAQQELKEKQKQQQQKPMQPSDPSARPLVDKLAELRMIRSLQFRVNGRTQRYARLLDDINDPVGRANDADLRQSLLKLAEMEQRVFEITRNIVLGKNE